MKNWKLLILGVTAMFLMQSCMVVRKTRPHHHHHRHCMFLYQQPTSTDSLNVPDTYMAIETPINYERKG
ncbi:conserved domain protein [Eggerthella sp. CAG:1427]|nr:conserved domain protein [Eggerthella sp. CAG:1427]